MLVIIKTKGLNPEYQSISTIKKDKKYCVIRGDHAELLLATNCSN